MTYMKPELLGYSAFAAIQDGSPNKNLDILEGGHSRTDPAYQADE
ncbi:MAG: hypothetical protein JWQ87_5243 [Candidatus Sulfotelmatobacter sp.]|nr:hypothetical protein [Candidatus Sulfotelmatobacter sp.]